MTKIQPVHPDIVKLVTETANDISKAKGHLITFKEAEVEIILGATRIVNAAIKTMQKGVKT